MSPCRYPINPSTLQTRALQRRPAQAHYRSSTQKGGALTGQHGSSSAVLAIQSSMPADLKPYTLNRQVLARQEAGTRPVPRTVLVCCAALTTVGPQTKGIFSESAGADLVKYH